eukprot:4083246-Amphidinium_carterae.1
MVEERSTSTFDCLSPSSTPPTVHRLAILHQISKILPNCRADVLHGDPCLRPFGKSTTETNGTINMPPNSLPSSTSAALTT